MTSHKRKVTGDKKDEDPHVNPHMPCLRVHGGKVESEKVETVISNNTDDTGLIQQMCGAMPEEAYLAIMKSTNHQPYKLQSGSQTCGEFLSIQVHSVLQSTPDLSITRINEVSKAFVPDHRCLMETHMEVNKSDIKVIDTGSGNEMEQCLEQ
ncbi:hypothetical protein BGZ49_004432 [Haplosporangium sp. Z 27]|nr:hypothetical protein BGZ49_004432 [Haplosporangium sp. Z 27]